VIEAILFDLDDTLLGNDSATFMRGYFSLLGKHARQFMEQDRFMQALLTGTQAMIQNTDPDFTNREVFWSVFQQSTGLDPQELEPFFDKFYRNQFSDLADLTQVKPEAAKILNFCLEQDLKVIIATNPLFPRVAIEARLEWAGVPASQFDYHLITAYENMHAAKPHPAYYREILDRIACRPSAALMVGDDWERDILPTAGMGLYTYWIQKDSQEPPKSGIATACGTLASLYDRLQAGWPRWGVGPS
jgi:FMN phosphatase YigB (HAD superfamily)